MDCENMFSEYTVLEKTRFFRIKGFGKIRIRKCGFEVRFRKNTVLENAVFGIYGFGKTQFFRINCFRKKYGSENAGLKKS